MMSEKIELLGGDVYASMGIDIPKQLTLKALPTICELDYVGAEDFEETMLNVIFPTAIEEDIPYNKLLEIDFQWICRCLRFLNYGPFFTVNAIMCPHCGPVRREAQVDLRAVECKALPADFSNELIIPKGELVDFNEEIHLHLLTIQEALNCEKDNLFKRPNGEINIEFARICYSISAIGKDAHVTPVSAKITIENKLSPADYRVLRSKVAELIDYGLRGGGRCQCPQCQSKEAAFMALADDRFFRPSVGDIRKGKDDRSLRGVKKPTRDSAETI